MDTKGQPTRIAVGAKTTSAQLSDALDSLGCRGCVMAGGIASRNMGDRVVGPARTIRFRPETDPVHVAYSAPDPYRAAIEFIDSIGTGEVIMVASGGDPRSAYWGELFSAAAMGRGAAGTICDGFIRDTARILDLGYPVFSLGARPLDYRARMRVDEVHVPIECAGVPVTPGDVVVGDSDGVVVIPSEFHNAAVTAANERANIEPTVLKELKAGSTLADAWLRHRTL